MDYLAILAMVQKGIIVAQALLEAGKSAEPALSAISNLVSGAQEDNVTDEMLTSTEAILDTQIEEFNLDIEA